MEAQEGTDAPTTTEAQEAPQPQVPQELTERLDELSGRWDQLEPLLQGLQPQQQEEQQQQPGIDEYLDENGLAIDPDGLQGFIASEAQRIATEQVGPLQQQMQSMQDAIVDQDIDALAEDYPELQDEGTAKNLAQRAQQFAAQNQMPQLARNAEFLEMLYLAGRAMQQAQQEVPAGGQDVHLEGGSGTPGQPEVNATQERFDRLARQGSAGGPWGRPIGEL